MLHSSMLPCYKENDSLDNVNNTLRLAPEFFLVRTGCNADLTYFHLKYASMVNAIFSNQLFTLTTAITLQHVNSDDHHACR